MEFPPWAPAELCDHYRKFYQEPRSYWSDRDWERRRLLERLLTSQDPGQNMEPCWAEILKRCTQEGAVVVLYHHIEDAAMRVGEQSTRQGKAEKYLAISKAAREFARLVEGSLLDTPPYRWFPVDAANTLLEQMGPSPGLLCLIEPAEGYSREAVFSLAPPAKDGKQYLWPVAGSVPDLLEHTVKPKYPTVSYLAKAIAKESDRIASQAGKEPRLLERPGTPKARQTAFIRTMLEVFVQEFGSPLWGTLATLTAVALEDETIGVSYVRDAARGWRYSPIKDPF